MLSHAEVPYLIDLSSYVGRKLTLSSETKDHINIGTFPIDIVDSYNNIARKLKEKNEEIKKFQETADKAFEKFRKCRSEVQQSSLRKAKKLELSVRHLLIVDSL